MNGNAVFVIILIVIYLFAIYGKHQGFFQTCVPVLSIVFSVCLPALVLPEFSKRFAEDAGRLDAKELVIDLMSFVIAFVVVRYVFKLILKLLRPVLDLPGLRSIDRTLGLFAGLFAGIVAVWLIFFLGVFFLGQEGMEPFFAMMETSPPLKFIYNHNLLMTLVNKVVFS